MMNHTIMFDNRRDLFREGEHHFFVQSWRRETIDRSTAGLDGVVSIDLGMRERKIKQEGILSACSKTALLKIIDELSGYIDGHAYTLVDLDGVSYEQVRMDHFQVTGAIYTGGVCRCDYEIIYTQLSN